MLMAWSKSEKLKNSKTEKNTPSRFQIMISIIISPPVHCKNEITLIQDKQFNINSKETVMVDYRSSVVVEKLTAKKDESNAQSSQMVGSHSSVVVEKLTANKDELTTPMSSSQLIRNFCGRDEDPDEGICKSFVIAPSEDTTEDYVATMTHLLDRLDDYPNPQHVMRTKYTDPRSRARRYNKEHGIVERQIPMLEKKRKSRKSKKEPPIEKVHVMPAFNGIPANYMTPNDLAWDRINRLLTIRITPTVTDTRTTFAMVDMSYDYHKVHLNIPNLIKNRNAELAAEAAMTDAQRAARKKWFTDIMEGNYPSAKKKIAAPPRASEIVGASEYHGYYDARWILEPRDEAIHHQDCTDVQTDSGGLDYIQSIIHDAEEDEGEEGEEEEEEGEVHDYDCYDLQTDSGGLDYIQSIIHDDDDEDEGEEGEEEEEEEGEVHDYDCYDLQTDSGGLDYIQSIIHDDDEEEEGEEGEEEDEEPQRAICSVVNMEEIFDAISDADKYSDNYVELTQTEKDVVRLINPDYKGDYLVPNCKWINDQQSTTTGRVLYLVGRHQSRKERMTGKALQLGISLKQVRKSERTPQKVATDNAKKYAKKKAIRNAKRKAVKKLRKI
jgi:hypothetical protein